MRWRILLVAVLLLGMGGIATAQQGTEAQLLTALNQARSATGLAPLAPESTLNKLALNLLNTIDEQCNYDASQDAALAQAAGWNSDFAVVRDCGVNHNFNQAATTFSTIQSTVTNAPLLNNPAWNSVGLAVGEQASPSGGVQYRYIMVLGVGSSSAPVALDAELAFAPLNLIVTHPSAWGGNLALNSSPLGDMGLAPDAGIEESDKLIRTQQGLTVAQSQDSGVMGYHARTLVGTDAAGQGVLVTFWRSEGNLALMTLRTPSLAEAQAQLPAWEQVLAGIRPSNALPLTQNVTSTFLHSTVLFPDGWTVFDGADRFGVFELSTDYELYQLGQDSFYTGIVITALFQPVEQVIAAGLLKTEGNLEELLALNTQFVGLQNPIVGEAFAFGQPAYTTEAVMASGFYSYGVMGFVQGNVYFILATAPDPQAILQFKPTFHWMIQNLAWAG